VYGSAPKPLGSMGAIRPVPRFFFHVREGDRLIDDPEGAEFPDLETAEADALVSARELLAGRLRKTGTLGDQRFEISDEAGRVLAEVPLRDAILDL
jgi:hypothetical protein